MIDRREAILARLIEVIEPIPGIEKTYRNNPNPNQGQMPAVVVFDADEEISELPEHQRYKGATAPAFLVMKPEIFIVLSDTAANAGSRLNELRVAIYKAIVSDEMLNAIVTPNGRINLHSNRSGFAVGRSIAAEMKLEFAFTYPLIFAEL